MSKAEYERVWNISNEIIQKEMRIKKILGEAFDFGEEEQGLRKRQSKVLDQAEGLRKLMGKAGRAKEEDLREVEGLIREVRQLSREQEGVVKRLIRS